MKLKIKALIIAICIMSAGILFRYAAFAATETLPKLRDLTELNKLLNDATKNFGSSQSLKDVEKEIAPLLFPIKDTSAQNKNSTQSQDEKTKNTSGQKSLKTEKSKEGGSANINVSSFAMDFKVEAVEEDAASVRDPRYYVRYLYKDIEWDGGLWRYIQKTKIIEVSKNGLKGGDLGLYLAEKFKRIEYRRKREVLAVQARLQGLPEWRKKADDYSFLSGKILKEGSFDGYRPVVDSLLELELNGDTKKVGARGKSEISPSSVVSQKFLESSEKEADSGVLSPKIPDVLPLLLF